MAMEMSMRSRVSVLRRRYDRPVTMSMTRRLFQLVEPVAVVTYVADEPTEAVMALGLRNGWDAYFAVHPEKSKDWRHRMHELEDWSFDILSHWLVG